MVLLTGACGGGQPDPNPRVCHAILTAPEQSDSADAFEAGATFYDGQAQRARGQLRDVLAAIAQDYRDGETALSQLDTGAMDGVATRVNRDRASLDRLCGFKSAPDS